MIIELSSRPFLKRACEESYTKQQISHEKMGHSISAEGKIMIVVFGGQIKRTVNKAQQANDGSLGILSTFSGVIAGLP